MSEHVAAERISVSREALRAELAELELRLVRYLDDQLHQKANKVEIVALNTALQDKANATEFGEVRTQLAVHDAHIDGLLAQQRVNDLITADYYIVKTQVGKVVTRLNIAVGAVAVIGATALVNVLKLWFGVG